jgi:hypothetical protein
MMEQKITKLNENNYQSWRDERMLEFQEANIDKTVLYDSFQAYYVSQVKNEIHLEYLEEIKLIDADARKDAPTKLAEKKILNDSEKYAKERTRWERVKQTKAELWEGDDKKAKAKIQKSVEQIYLSSIKDLASARLMWLKLEEERKSSQGGARAAAYRAFNQKKYDKTGTLMMYFTAKHQLYENMIGLGLKLPLDIVYLDILTNLPSEFDQLEQSLTHVKDDDQTLNLIRTTFASEDLRIEAKKANKKEEKEKDQEEANAAMSNRKCDTCKTILPIDQPERFFNCKPCHSKKMRADKEERRKKFEKKKREEEKANNVEKEEKSKKSMRQTTKTKKKRKDSEEESEESNNVLAYTLDQSKSKLSNKETWFLDSAATASITNNKNFLINTRRSNIKVSGPHINAKSSRATIV